MSGHKAPAESVAQPLDTGPSDSSQYLRGSMKTSPQIRNLKHFSCQITNSVQDEDRYSHKVQSEVCHHSVTATCFAQFHRAKAPGQEQIQRPNRPTQAPLYIEGLAKNVATRWGTGEAPTPSRTSGLRSGGQMQLVNRPHFAYVGSSSASPALITYTTTLLANAAPSLVAI